MFSLNIGKDTLHRLDARKVWSDPTSDCWTNSGRLLLTMEVKIGQHHALWQKTVYQSIILVITIS
jgi:hypothetical protein